MRRKQTVLAAISALAVIVTALLYKYFYSGTDAATIGIIGGADGPTQILVGKPSGLIFTIALLICGLAALVSFIALLVSLLKKRDN